MLDWLAKLLIGAKEMLDAATALPTPSTLLIRGAAAELVGGSVVLEPAAIGSILKRIAVPPDYVTTTNTLVETGDSGNKWSNWKLRGTFNASAMGSGILYAVGDVNAGCARIRFYNDIAHTHLVGHGQLGDDLGGTITIVQPPDNSSGLSGTVDAAAGVGTESGIVLTCSLPAFVVPFTVPDGHVYWFRFCLRGTSVAGDKAGELYAQDSILSASHVGATVLVGASTGTPANGLALASLNLADVEGAVYAAIDASGAVTIGIAGRHDNTIKWRWFIESLDDSLAS